MSVIKSIFASHRAIVLSLAALCGVPGLAAGVKSQRPGPESGLVKVVWTKETPVRVGNRIIFGSRVQEYGALAGAVIDDRGYLIAYVQYLPELDSPNVRVFVDLPEGKRAPATVTGFDERLSVVLLHCEGLADRAVTRGSDLRQDQLHFWTLTNGNWTKAALHVREMKQLPLLPDQEMRACPHSEEAEIMPCSGSLVTDEAGRFLGVVSSSRSKGLRSRPEYLGIIPATLLHESAVALLKGAPARRGGWLGVRMGPSGSHVQVEEVLGKDTPAYQAGLMPGDVIVSVNGTKLLSLQDYFSRLIHWSGPGAVLELGVDRDGSMETVRATLAAYPRSRLVASWVIELDGLANTGRGLKIYKDFSPRSPNFGFVTTELTAQFAKFLQQRGLYSPYEEKARGLVVTSVSEGSLAQSSGFRAGDILREVNGISLLSNRDLERALSSITAGLVTIRFLREGEEKTAKLRFH